MNVYERTIPALKNGMTTMQGLLKKAADHPRADALLDTKLADDMHPLAVQVRFLSNQPGEAIAQLTARSFVSRDDNVTTIADAAESISRTKTLLTDIRESEVVPGDHTLALVLPNGMEFSLTADAYVRDWVLPNFYFHLTIAYAILRSEGLDIGKADFLPQMAAYMTKMPGA